MRLVTWLSAAMLPAAAAAAQPRTLTAVFGNSPPMIGRDASGRPQGFAAEVFNEAARRAGITLEWKFGGNVQTNDEALRRGEIDLIPTGVETPERRRDFFVSSAWWAYDLVALVPARGVVREERQLAGRRLATPASAVAWVARMYPGNTIHATDNASQAAEEVCADRADAALLGEMHLRELLFAPSQACAGFGLSSFNTASSLGLVIVARREVTPLASELRRAIDDLALDGTLAVMAARHPPLSSPHALRVADALRGQQERRMWITWLAAGSALVVLTGAFLLIQRRTNRRLRLMNDRLRESDERWRFALEGAGAGVWDWDPQTNGTFYSSHCRAMIGYDPEDQVAELTESVHPDDLARTRELLDKHMSGLTPMFAAEYRLRCKDGSYKWVLARGKAVQRDPEGKPRRCLGTFTDITSIKEAEAAGQKLHELYLRASSGPEAANS